MLMCTLLALLTRSPARPTRRHARQTEQAKSPIQVRVA
ncbi:hypothetical protein KPSA1_03341 [Pseudomonas syringae pv. actinidiae]|uniref:Uncharacterized protein n=1 Tax=Pseudomonas syringae pv. actinidiae TaxID=103796 RepID=A0A2V0QBE4_PSESF|nr:hypothetical protein KPSA1_03341 [Pseudomonas syringae pv. actinidiae]